MKYSKEWTLRSKIGYYEDRIKAIDENIETQKAAKLKYIRKISDYQIELIKCQKTSG
jgi:hypothetical protein